MGSRNRVPYQQRACYSRDLEQEEGSVKVLISGGAGFIGSTIASALIDAGHVPVILDSLVTGRREFTAGRVFYHGDICDGGLLDRVFAEHPDICAAVHCAALIVVPIRWPTRCVITRRTSPRAWSSWRACCATAAAGGLQFVGGDLRAGRGPERGREVSG